MIALFTDFGTRDAYVAQMKGAMVGINPRLLLLDLNHEVGRFAIREAAYLLEKSARYFPAGTIFVAVVDPGVGTARRALLVETQARKFYVGPDNGLFTRVLAAEGLQAAYELVSPAYFRVPDVSPTFHGRDVFGPVAAHLTLGVEPAAFGPRLDDVCRLSLPVPRRQGQTVSGEVIHIDHFGNVVSNIPAALLAGVAYGALLHVTMHDRGYRLPLLRTYGEGTPGRLMGLLNSDEEFEVALPQGEAAAYCRARVGEGLTVRWQLEGG